MSHISYTAAEILGIDALMNSQSPGKDAAGLVGGGALNSGPPPRNAVGSVVGEAGRETSSQPSTPVPQNNAKAPPATLLEVSRPVKTEGQASPSLSTLANPPPASGASLLLAHQGHLPLATGPGGAQTSSADGAPGASSLPLTMQGAATIGAFGSPLTALGAELKLTHEEQAAAYKKANILALSALAKKGGPNAKEMLAVQAKLQEFLTNLISLAGTTGQQLKSTVQLLVQQLVTGAVGEKEFAMRIEKDLHSQHQPSLLPFLQNSVPHLRTRLQLQQAIMKELLQRQAQEKFHKRLQSQKQAQDGVQAASVHAANSSGPVRGPQSLQQHGVVGVMGSASISGGLGAVKIGLTQQQQQQIQNQMKFGEGGGFSQLPSLAGGSQFAPPLPISSTLSQPQLSSLHSLPGNATTPNASPVPPSTSTSAPTPSSASLSIPLPISTTGVAAQLRQLSKLTPQQRMLVMQQMQQLKKQQQQQQQQALGQVISVASPAIPNQAILLASQKLGVWSNALNSAQAPSVTNSSGAGAAVSTLNTQHVLDQQQRLVKEQQQFSLGLVGAAAKPTTLSVADASLLGGVSVGVVGLGAGQSGRNTSPSKHGGAQGKTSFSDLKIQSNNHSTSPISNVGTSKGKGRVKNDSGKTAADEDEEEDDEMDFSGVKTVNLQAESILPTTLGDTMRTVQDEAHFDLSQLRKRVTAIAQHYGLTHITDDYLVLLSHAIQERLRDILEKVTLISLHRTEPLKDEEHHETSSEVRGQLKVLESIDRLNCKRKQEREKEQILKAARSRSKAEDPETAAKIKEQAKRLQQEEEQKIRDRAANEAALAAIGSRSKRKRSSTTGLTEGAAGGLLSSLNSDTTGSHTSLLGTQATSRQPKRRVTARDVVFFMEQSRETKKSLVLYKSLLK